VFGSLAESDWIVGLTGGTKGSGRSSLGAAGIVIEGCHGASE